MRKMQKNVTQCILCYIPYTLYIGREEKYLTINFIFFKNFFSSFLADLRNGIR